MLRFLIPALYAVMLGTAAHAGSAFDGFGGRWVGNGTIHMTDGQQEKMKCVATYFPISGGTRMNMNVRCASAGYKIDVKGSLQAFDNRILGEFEERHYNHSGIVHGIAEGGNIDATITGDDWLASITVKSYGTVVTMTPHSGPVKIASFTFTKG
ncbi:hypothetical protein HY413_03670 [Candidatus Kaiserbacteria bacterium]|nr:hypothetical protein [Candidatus Kaiserbacteria bacterium]